MAGVGVGPSRRVLGVGAPLACYPRALPGGTYCAWGCYEGGRCYVAHLWVKSHAEACLWMKDVEDLALDTSDDDILLTIHKLLSI